MLITRITELLGIKHPVFQGAMAWVSIPRLRFDRLTALSLSKGRLLNWSRSNSLARS